MTDNTSIAARPIAEQDRKNMRDKCVQQTGSDIMPAIIYKGRTIPARPFGSVEYLTYCPELHKRLG